MYKIRNNQIFLTRGDSACIILTIEDDDGNEYTPSANDIITFTVKKSPYNKKVLIQHTFSNNKLFISPEDTMNLESLLILEIITLIWKNLRSLLSISMRRRYPIRWVLIWVLWKYSISSSET